MIPSLGLLSRKLEALPLRFCAVLTGKSTLNRLEHAPKTDDDRYRKLCVDEGAMKRLFVSLFLTRPCLRRRSASSLISTRRTTPSMAIRKAVSFTATTNATAICRFISFAGGNCCVAKLRPANIDASAGAKEEIAFIVAQIRSSWPHVGSGFGRLRLLPR